METENANNLPSNINQRCRRSMRIKIINAEKSLELESVKRKILYDSPMNEIGTRNKKFKPDNACNFPSNVIQTRTKKIITENIKNLLKPKSIKSQKTISLMELPNPVLESILGNLSFHEIATLRIVNRKFEEICKRLLNKGYQFVVHQNILESIRKAGKLTMPFKYHLYNIDTHLSLLDLVFYHHINENRCCFFPGKVLDIICDVFLIENKVDTFMFEDKAQTMSFKRIATQSEVYMYLTYKRLNNILDVSVKAMKYAVENIFPAFKISIKKTRVILLSSTPMLLDQLVLKSALGNLEYSDFDDHFSMANQVFNKDIWPRISMRDHLKMIKIKYNSPIQKLDQYHVPEKILGSFDRNGRQIFLVKWKGLNEAVFIHENQIYMQYFDIIFKYYGSWLKVYSIGNKF